MQGGKKLGYYTTLPKKRPCAILGLWRFAYGVALVSRIDKIIGLFCERALYKRRYSAKEIYNFIDPTDRSHPIHAPESHKVSFAGEVYNKRVLLGFRVKGVRLTV